ncbi:MAG: hypothetical protein KGH50_03805 [Candidatus Micrarchaeota archaeon]|nr:hypothetical protein [Candidatus Micrarchaeota archaeon]
MATQAVEISKANIVEKQDKVDMASNLKGMLRRDLTSHLDPERRAIVRRMDRKEQREIEKLMRKTDRKLPKDQRASLGVVKYLWDKGIPATHKDLGSLWKPVLEGSY